MRRAGRRSASDLAWLVSAVVCVLLAAALHHTLRAQSSLVRGLGIEKPAAVHPGMIDNGDFSRGRSGWSVFEEPDMVWHVAGGVFQFHKANPIRTASQQAVVYQETGQALAADAVVAARFDIGNTSVVRKRIMVLLLNSDFADLSVCTFWLGPSAPLRTYQMQTHTTEAWSNAAVYFYAASDNAAGDTGDYLLDNVSVEEAEPTQSNSRTDCMDPTAPPAGSGASSANLVGNGGFSGGSIAPWKVYGDMTAQIDGGVFEFIRPGKPNAPAGVILQETHAAMTAGQTMTASLQLGNSSAVRKRVTMLLHESDFSDFTACTFWLAPRAQLATFTMRGVTTRAWTNATV